MNARKKGGSSKIEYSSLLVIQQKLWGLPTTSDCQDDTLESLEMMAKILAIVLTVLGALVWLSGCLPELQDLSGRTLLSGAMVILGMQIYSRTSRGLINEIQIDGKKEFLRLGSRNSSGSFRKVKSYDFDELVSVFIRRSRDREALATLNITTTRDDMPVQILRGTETALVPILDHLVDLNTNRPLIGRGSRPQTTGKWSSVQID